jgi:uncharacterized protein YegL
LNGTVSADLSFELQQPRPLPVVVLADASGSMGQDNKIEALNTAIETMTSRLSREDSATTEITLSAIAFSDERADLHLPPTPVSEVHWTKLRPSGLTPMGKAFTRAAEMMQDEKLFPADAYLPTFVLVSDGVPTDNWEDPLKIFLATKAGGALRLAVAVGADADANSYHVLERFVANSAIPVVRADEIDKISIFFQAVTRTITTRVRSTTPDDISAVDVSDLRDLVS